MIKCEGFEKEVLPKPKFHPIIHLEGPRKITKTTVRIAGVPPEIRTEHLQNMSPKLYLYARPLVS